MTSAGPSHVLRGAARAGRGGFARVHGDDVAVVAGLNLERLRLRGHRLIVRDRVAAEQRRLQVRALVRLRERLGVDLRGFRV